jgi:hypothetical protein
MNEVHVVAIGEFDDVLHDAEIDTESILLINDLLRCRGSLFQLIQHRTVRRRFELCISGVESCVLLDDAGVGVLPVERVHQEGTSVDFIGAIPVRLSIVTQSATGTLVLE